MSKPAQAPYLDEEYGDDEEVDNEDLFASPTTTQKHTPISSAASASNSAHKSQNPTHSSDRDARLQAELDRLRSINQVIESVTASLTKAKDNMAVVNRTVSNASTLLETWSRILSQTEHNQRLILDPAWEGAGKDVEEMEAEETRKGIEAERRRAEEERRREEAERRREEEERRKMVAPSETAGRGTGRGRVSNRGVSGRGFGGVGGPSSRGRVPSSTTRGGTGVGRGVAGTRGRGRGMG